MTMYNPKDQLLISFIEELREPIKHDLLNEVSFDKETTCWNWKGYKSELNYGIISIQNKTFYTHRVSYTLFHKPIPKGLVVHHMCNNRACCNPEHLDIMTQIENVSMNGSGSYGHFAARTHCVNGHELSNDNLVQSSLKKGKTECLKCNNKRVRLSKFRKSITVEWVSN